MNHLLSTAFLTCLTLPLAAQRYDPATVRGLQLQVDQNQRMAQLDSLDRSPFFAIVIASTKDSTMRIAGFDLLIAEAVVATAEVKDGSMKLDLGAGGWGFDVYLQGIGLFDKGEAMASNIAVVKDEPKPKK